MAALSYGNDTFINKSEFTFSRAVNFTRLLEHYNL